MDDSKPESDAHNGVFVDTRTVGVGIREAALELIRARVLRHYLARNLE